MLKYTDAHNGRSSASEESVVSGSRPITRTSSNAKWEIGWRDPDAMLKISIYKESEFKKAKGAPEKLRNRILNRVTDDNCLVDNWLDSTCHCCYAFLLDKMETALLQVSSPTQKSRIRSHSNSEKSAKYLNLFRKLVRSVILLCGCFRMRRKYAIQSADMTLIHQEKDVDLRTRKRCSISTELRLIFSIPPEIRTSEEIHKIQYYLRACGANRLLVGASTPEETELLGRHVAYERYENDRVVAQKGRQPDRFYFIVTGKLLKVKEYHINTGIISKTIGCLTKGMTTDVEEMEQRIPRKESLICRGPVEALVLDRDEYFLIHGERGGAPTEFLSRHFLFYSFPFHSVGRKSQNIRLQYYQKGSTVFHGGTDFEWIYVIKSGQCSLIRFQTVADIKHQKRSLFNKRTAHKLGCGRTTRTHSAAEGRASFRMWKGPPRPPLYSINKRTCHSSSAIASSLHARKQPAISSHGSHSSLGDTRTHHYWNDNAARDMVSRRGNQWTKEERGGILPQLSGFFKNEENADIDQNSKTSRADVQYSGTQGSLFATSLAKKIPLTKPRWNKILTIQRVNKQQNILHDESPLLRRAFVELGKLKPGDVLGLEKSSIEDLPHVRLISDAGSEVVLFKRNFFLRNAPTSLLSRISCRTNNYPNIVDTRDALETVKTWELYKSSLMSILTTKRDFRELIESDSFSRKFKAKAVIPFYFK